MASWSYDSEIIEFQFNMEDKEGSGKAFFR